MNNSKNQTNMVRVRHILVIAQRILGLILLILEIYRQLRDLHLF